MTSKEEDEEEGAETSGKKVIREIIHSRHFLKTSSPLRRRTGRTGGFRHRPLRVQLIRTNSPDLKSAWKQSGVQVARKQVAASQKQNYSILSRPGIALKANERCASERPPYGCFGRRPVCCSPRCVSSGKIIFHRIRTFSSAPSDHTRFILARRAPTFTCSQPRSHCTLGQVSSPIS